MQLVDAAWHLHSDHDWHDTKGDTELSGDDLLCHDQQHNNDNNVAIDVDVLLHKSSQQQQQQQPSLWCFLQRLTNRDAHHYIHDDDYTTDDDLSCASSVLSSMTNEHDTTALSSKRCVSFSTVEIREHDITRGDHPYCQDGQAVSLDWGHHPETVVVSIDLHSPLDPPQPSSFSWLALLSPKEEETKWSGRRPVRRLTYAERKLRLSALDEEDVSGWECSSFTREPKDSFLDGHDYQATVVDDDNNNDNEDDVDDLPLPPDLEPLSFLSQAT